MPSDEFELATVEIEKVNGVVSDNDLLELYAFYKQATGADFSAAKKPGMFDIQGKYKYSAWEKEKDTSPEDAEKKYIEKVEALKEQHGYDATRTKKADNKPIDDAKLKKFDELSKKLGKNQ